MNKVLATLSIGTLMVLAAPGVANAKGGGGVTVNGKCSAASSSNSISTPGFCPRNMRVASGSSVAHAEGNAASRSR